MRERGPGRSAPPPSRRPRSTTGTSVPRSSITPSIGFGAPGSGVGGWKRTTSRSCATSMPTGRPPTSKQPSSTRPPSVASGLGAGIEVQDPVEVDDGDEAIVEAEEALDGAAGAAGRVAQELLARRDHLEDAVDEEARHAALAVVRDDDARAPADLARG